MQAGGKEGDPASRGVFVGSTVGAGGWGPVGDKAVGGQAVKELIGRGFDRVKSPTVS